MKKINIEVFFQKNKSLDRGPVSVRMILNYFSVDIKESELKKSLFYNNLGTYIYDNGLLFLKEGLKVELITANPLLFSQEIRSKLKSNKEIFTYFNKFTKKKPQFKEALSIFSRFLNENGSVKIQIPDISHIHKAIDKNNLILASLYGKALGENEGGFHFIVVTGYKKGFVYINNPSRIARQGWFPEKDFLYALHASTCADIDNGSLLIVGK